MKKKSGAAQRLVSLVLALGLIFTLAPASVFAGDEVPASSTVVTTTEEEPVVDGTEPVVDGTEPVVDGTEPVVDGTEPAVNGSEPVADDSEPVVDDSAPVVDGTEPVVDGTEPVVDGTEPVADGTEPVVEEELSSQQTALLAASVPAVMSGAPMPRSIFQRCTFNVESNTGVYALVTTDGGKTGTQESIPVTHELSSSEDQVYFLVNVPENGKLTVKYKGTFDVKEKDGEINPVSNAPAAVKSLAETAGCTHYFVFSGYKTAQTINIKVNLTVPQEDTCEVKVNDGVLTNGAYFDPTLPVTVKKGDSLTVTLYGPNEAGIGRLLSSLTVEDGEGGKHVSLKIPMNTEGTATRNELDNATITVKYLGTNIENWLYRAKYEITLENIQDDITFVGLTTREWMKKAVIIQELTGISELEYKGIDGEWTDVDVSSIADGPIEIEFDNYSALDKEFWEGHFSVINIRYKVAEDYENPQLTLLNGKINKDPKPDEPDTEGWYTFDITIGRVNSGDDIEVWFDSDEYYVDMRLTAEEKMLYPAEVYLHEEGKTDVKDYAYIGYGTVNFGKPDWGKSYDLTNPDYRKEVTVPPFKNIILDGVEYEYSLDSTEAGTYNFVGWEVAKAVYAGQAGPDAILEWHVDGIIKLNKELPKELQPTPIDTTVTYDGTEKKLNIDYPDGKSENDYVIEYSKDGINWVSGVPSGTNVADKLENIKIRFTMEDYVPYEAPVTYTLEITQRPITLKANDDKIVDGEPIPQFSYTITSGSLAEGDNIIDVTYGGYANKLGIYNLVITGYKIVDAKDNNADVAGNYDVTLLPGIFTIGTSGGGGGTTPTPNPNPNPTPVPVEPETPVTPVTPVTPEEEEEEPEEVETIEEEETPQASPDTDADKEDDKTETIEDEETAQAGAPGEGNWALLNLILMVLTVVAGLGMLALRFARKTGMAHLLGIVPAIVALVAFFVTEDMSLPMAMTDKWTLIMAVIALVQVALLLLGRNSAQDEDEQPREQY